MGSDLTLNFKLNTPVVFIIFKRPDTTQKVFEAIRQAKPSKLFVIADGARLDHKGEKEKCDITRSIINQVDWNCEVFQDYSDINLGCAKRVSSGLNWVFQHVEEAIILEDDCLPHPSFFPFCEELLKTYRYDERIGSISGQNVQFGDKRSKYSYYFSRYNHIWGWATWKRAWKHYDFEMKDWLEIKENKYLNNILINKKIAYYWNNRLQETYDGLVNSWAYRWQMTCWLHRYLGLIPNNNLISNIGFGNESTNTYKSNHQYANLQTKAVEFPLQHPKFIFAHLEADNFTENTLFAPSNFFSKIKLDFQYLLAKNL
jgi:hypothetical protein